MDLGAAQFFLVSYSGGGSSSMVPPPHPSYQFPKEEEEEEEREGDGQMGGGQCLDIVCNSGHNRDGGDGGPG